MSFWGELNRRNVVKVGAAYAVVSWLLIQVADVVLPTFGAPTWVQPTITFLLIIGFPVVLIVAWAFEITPDGIKKTDQVRAEDSIAHVTGQKLNYVVMGLLVLAVAYMAVDGYVLDDRTADATSLSIPATDAAASAASPPAEAPSAEAVLANSVAVLPLENLSTDPDNAFIAAGLHEEILNQLAKLRDLNVISRTSVLQYAENRPAIQEIGRALNVESVLEGSVRYAGARIRVTTQLIDAATGAHLWSETYDRVFTDIFAIESDIAMNVANALAAEFTPAEQASLERAPTTSTEAYELYLAAQGQFQVAAASRALASIDAALEIDPEFAAAWVLKANIHLLASQGAPADSFAAEQAAWLEAAQEAARIDPTLPSAQSMRAAALGNGGDWIEAERGFRRALDAETSSRVSLPYAIHAAAAGHFDRARDLAALARQNDPLDQTARGFLILALALGGDAARADAEHARGTTVFGDNWFGNWFISMARLGTDAAVAAEDVPFWGSATGIHATMSEYLDSPDEGLARLREIYAADASGAISDLLQMTIWAGYLGDPALAFEANERAVRRNATNMLTFWLPSLREVRQLPQFKSLVREIGLLDYWNELGWPDTGICRPLAGDDFACL